MTNSALVVVELPGRNAALKPEGRVADSVTELLKPFAGVTPIDSVDAAVRASIAKHRDRAVAVIPEGPYVIPQSR